MLGICLAGQINSESTTECSPFEILPLPNPLDKKSIIDVQHVFITMLSLLMNSLMCMLLAIVSSTSAQSSASGYVGYNLTLEGDQNAVVYSTDETRPNASSTEPAPDVYLNASVHVSTIDLTVDNLTAKVNLEAQVLNLLQFNAGVDVSVDKVRLLIQDVNAKVLLEARLKNLVYMINDTLNSIDLNPIIATLGQDVGDIVNTTGSALGSATSSLSARSLDYDLTHNILYSINDYSGNTHTNRILEQNGDVIDQFLNNDGRPEGYKVIGTFKTLMTFNGYETTVERDGEEVTEREYTYSPYHGINVISAIYTNAAGDVIGTQVIAESSAGGGSTIAGEL